MYFAAPTARRSRRARRAVQAANLTIALVFALFISVANATAEELGAPPADQPAPVEASMESMEPVVEQAPAPSPVVEPAPVVEQPAPVVEQPAPVVESTPAVEEAPAPQPEPIKVEEPQERVAAVVANVTWCKATGQSAWDYKSSISSDAYNTSGVNQFNVIGSNGPSGTKNIGNFVRGGVVYNGQKLLDSGCSTSGGTVGLVGEIVSGPITMCEDDNSNTWTSLLIDNEADLDAHSFSANSHNDDIVPSFTYLTATGGTASFAGHDLTSSFSKNGFSRTGQQILDGGCAFPPDQCTNISDYQGAVPTGNTSTNGICKKDVLANGNVTFCHAEYFLIWLVGYDSRSGNLSNLQNHAFWDGDDIIPAYSYFDGSGVLKQVAAKGNQQILANGCSTTPQEQAATCHPDQTATDTNGNGIKETCVNKPDASCLSDQTAQNLSGGPTKETCVNNPDATCFADQVATNVTGGPTKETCVNKPDASCETDQTAQNLSGGPTKESCVNNPDATCLVDQTATNLTGGPTKETCVNNPDATCLVDQTPTDKVGGPTKETCVDNPDASCLVDQTATNKVGGPSKETCVDNPDVTCAFADQHPEDKVGGPSKETCVDNPNATCLFDEEPYSASGSPTSLESCRGKAMPNCSAPGANGNGIAIDTNANGNPDTCATLVATSCRVLLDSGIQLRWTWTNNYGVTITAPYGGAINTMYDGGNVQPQPTSFASGTGSFNSTTGLNGAAWFLTGNVITGNSSSAACFEDQCDNLEPADQETIPTGLVRSGTNNCVTAPPTCAFDQDPKDDGSGTAPSMAGDGIVDRCQNKADVQCLFDETATDTNGNGALDTCKLKPNVTDCKFDEVARDTNRNGSKDTCVPKANVFCGLRVGVDTNGNGSLDTCIEITPRIICGVYETNGSRTLRWNYRNDTPYTVSIPVGSAKNSSIPSGAQPSTFAPGTSAEFTSNVTSGFFGGLTSHTWALTGNTAIGFYSSALTPSCFEDACPNLVGDQQDVPPGLKLTTNKKKCLPETTSCAKTDERVDDSNADGVNDRCVGVPVTCEGGQWPIDTNGNSNPDTCVTVTPVLDCVENLADGSSDVNFYATSSLSDTVSIPVGPSNSLTGGTGTQPTSFAPGDSETFSVNVAGDTAGATWTLTGIALAAGHDSTPCFEDACVDAEHPGDQRDVPEGFQANNRGECLVPVTECAFDERVDDSDEDGVNDRCVGVPAECATGQFPFDTNENGNADACATLTLALTCVKNMPNGSSLAGIVASYESKRSVTIPVGAYNSLTGGTAELPTEFAGGDTEATIRIPADSTSATWTLTSSSLTVTHTGTPCFVDACPNEARFPGDQQDVPAEIVVNNRGECVDAPTTCEPSTGTGETPRDNDGDGVIDTCVPITCVADHVGIDTGTNQVADACLANPVKCDTTTHEAKDLLPAGAPNGVADTCVAKTVAAPGGGDANPGTGPGSGDTPGQADGGDGTPDDAETGVDVAGAGEEPGTGDGAEGEPVDGGDGDDLPFTGLALGLLVALGLGGVLGGIAIRQNARRAEKARATKA